MSPSFDVAEYMIVQHGTFALNRLPLTGFWSIGSSVLGVSSVFSGASVACAGASGAFQSVRSSMMNPRSQPTL